MALYEYKCGDCAEMFDLMRSMESADDPADCPSCGASESRRLVSSFASVTPGDSALSSNPMMNSRIASGGGGGGGGGCCGGSCCS